MKKSLLSLLATIVILLLLPLIGNSVADNILKRKISILTSNGVKVQDKSIDSSYLSTKKHYKFSVIDAMKFVKYLNQYSNAQIPPYVNTMLDGVTVGVDLKYSNLFFSSNIDVDIYPLSLSKNMMRKLKKEDVDFYIYLKALFESRAVLYHINYSLYDEDFNGYLKNMDEEYRLEDGTKLDFKVIDATFNGQGSLIAPERLQAEVKDIIIKAKSTKKEVGLVIDSLSSVTSFQSHSTYLSSGIIKKFFIFSKDIKSGELKASANDIKLNISSNIQGNKAEFYSKGSIDKLTFNSKLSNIMASNLNYDISLRDIDKDSYEELRKLTSYSNVKPSVDEQKKLRDLFLKVISRGLTLDIADISMQKIAIGKKKPVGGFSLMAKLVLKGDKNLIKNSVINSTFKISKELYAIVNRSTPMSGFAEGLAKEDGNNLIFNIKLSDGHVMLNDKVLN